jgi:hypothetical protein
MPIENRIRAAHHFIRSFILGALAFYVSRLSHSGSLSLYAESGTLAGIRLAALALYVLGAGQLYATLAGLQGRNIQSECGCGAHSASGGIRQWTIYAVFALPLVLGLLPDPLPGGEAPARGGIHLHGASPHSAPEQAPADAPEAGLGQTDRFRTR